MQFAELLAQCCSQSRDRLSMGSPAVTNDVVELVGDEALKPENYISWRLPSV